jgi:hypothetical protein
LQTQELIVGTPTHTTHAVIAASSVVGIGAGIVAVAYAGIVEILPKYG